MIFNPNDADEIIRCVVGYNLFPDEHGQNRICVRYCLKKIDLNFLRKVFNINMACGDYGALYLLDCFPINEEQAKALQPYVINGIIDLGKYDFMLETRRTRTDLMT